MARILVFGASVTYGAFGENGGWVDRLKQYYHRKSLALDLKVKYFVYNLGVSGDTTADLLARYEDEVKLRMKSGDTNVSLFCIGLTDSQWELSRSVNKIDRVEFRTNIRNIIKISRRLNSIPIFVGLTPVDELFTDPIPWLEGFAYRNEYVEQYDEEIRIVCEDLRVGFVEVFNEFKMIDYQSMMVDGIHLTTTGHKKVYEIVRKWFEREDIF